MALHEELNLMLCRGQRECLHLKGLIRKLKSGQQMLMMKRDNAKKEMEFYVRKVSESLIEFRSDMYVSIKTEVEEKIKEITSLCEKVEADILSYMELCDETEKMVRFGESINDETDKCKAEQLLKEFRQLQKSTSDIGKIDEIMKLEFYPALPGDTIESSMFGDLIRGNYRGGYPKFTESSSSALRARIRRFDNDQSTQPKPKSDKPEVLVEKMDQYTQTDTVKEQHRNEPTNTTENQEEQHWNEPTNTTVTENQGRSLESTGYTLIPVDGQQCLSYPKTSPPGFEYVPLTYNYHNPRPGFSVYQRTEASQPLQVAGVPTANVQVNSCMLTDVPVYHQGLQYNQPYTALAAPAVNYQVQNAPLHQYNPVTSREQRHTGTRTPLRRRSHAIPIVSPNSDTEGKRVLNNTCEQKVNDREAINAEIPHSQVNNIPLPIGPALKENFADFKEKDKFNAERETKIEPTEKLSNNKCIKASPFEMKSEKVENVPGDVYKSGSSSDLQKFEMLLKRSTELIKMLESNNFTDGIDVTHRTDESIEVDSDQGNVKNTEELSKDENVSKVVSKGPFQATLKMYTDQMLSNIGQDLKEKLAKGEKVITPMRPLRRPLRLPKNYQGESKHKADSEVASCNGSVSTVVPGIDQKNATLKKWDENNNGLKECLMAKSEINEVFKTDMGTEMNEKDVTSMIAKDKVNVQSVENSVASKKVNATDHSANTLHTTDNDSKDTESQLETIGKCSRTEQTVGENANKNKGSATDRKADMKNLKSAVKGFLGGQKECAATYTRLGALQAHWLKHVPGTRIEAKYLFECTHDLKLPIGVTTNSLQQIIVADTGNHCVKMFDQEGQFIRVFGDGMRRPAAIVVNEFDHIFVKDDISIKVFDNLGDYIMDIATVFSKAFGLVLTPAKCLLVLETDRRHPALVHVSQDGNQVWRFPYEPLLEAPPGSKCRFMAVSENHVVVSDLGLSQIYITSFEGNFFKVIGSPGNGIMQFFEPSGISVDNYGNMVIGDSKNNRIQVYRHDGSYSGLINLDKAVIRPSGVHLTSDNKLIVVNHLAGAVKVYKLV